jgi:hypothetical protein
MEMSQAVKDEIPATGEDLVLDHIAEYIVQAFIKEDVNAFTESTLLQQLLAYKLKEIAKPMMYNTIRAAGRELVKAGKFDLKKKVGGITTQKRILFRSADQYNAFVSLYFSVVEAHPELVGFIDSEQSFENFMIYCVYEFKGQWDEFVERVTQERLSIEHRNRLYVNRSKQAEALQEVPTYADFVAEHVDAMAGEKPAE